MNRYIRRGAALGAAVLVTTAALALTSGSPAGAAKPLARAVLRNTSGVEIGEVVFKGQGKYADRVEVEIAASAAPNLGDFHGFHVHDVGACNPLPSGTANVPFGSAGGHWNPGSTVHGEHAGDMPSVLLSEAGTAYAEFETDRFDVTALLDASGNGSAVILHVDRDNFANIPTRYAAAGPDAATLATGDAGGRYACGVVEDI